MNIVISDFDKAVFKTLPDFDRNPKLWETFLDKQLGFLKKVSEDTYVCPSISIHVIIPLASILMEQERRRFLKQWASWIFPVNEGDENKIECLALLYRLKTTKFGFIYKPGKENEKPFLIKRFISQWEVMMDLTMAFEVDGAFLKFPFPLSDEVKEKIEGLIEEDRNLEEVFKKMKESDGKFPFNFPNIPMSE